MGTFTWKSGTTTKVVVSDQMVISQHLVEAEEPRKFSLLILCAFSIQAKLVARYYSSTACTQRGVLDLARST